MWEILIVSGVKKNTVRFMHWRPNSKIKSKKTKVRKKKRKSKTKIKTKERKKQKRGKPTARCRECEKKY